MSGSTTNYVCNGAAAPTPTPTVALPTCDLLPTPTNTHPIYVKIQGITGDVLDLRARAPSRLTQPATTVRQTLQRTKLRAQVVPVTTHPTLS